MPFSTLFDDAFDVKWQPVHGTRACTKEGRR